MTVFAAASLTDAFADVETTLEAANPGLDIVNNFAGSQALVTQFTEGAPADVAAFASNTAMTNAIEADVISGEPQTFAENVLTLVVPSDNPAGITSAADLANPGVKLVLAQEDVPVGGYSRESICNMAADTATYGDDFVANVAGNVVSEEDNVRAVLSKVALGEADAGIVYTSDVTDDVVALEIPADVNELANLSHRTGCEWQPGSRRGLYLLHPVARRTGHSRVLRVHPRRLITVSDAHRLPEAHARECVALRNCSMRPSRAIRSAPGGRSMIGHPPDRSIVMTPAAATERSPIPARSDQDRSNPWMRIGRWLAILAATAMVVFLALPLIGLLWRTVQRFDGLSERSATTLREALTLSLVTTTISIAIVLVLGTPLAYLLGRHTFRGKDVLETLIDLPIVLPPAVAGLALLMAFGRRGLVGEYLDQHFGITIGFTTTAVVMAQIFVASPFYVRAARAGFARVEKGMEEAAADLGADPWRVLRTVTLPMARPALGAGLVLAWARALGEFGATIMFAGSHRRSDRNHAARGLRPLRSRRSGHGAAALGHSRHLRHARAALGPLRKPSLSRCRLDAQTRYS